MTSGRTAQADHFGREKDSPVNGPSTSVEPAMNDRPGEHEAFLVFPSQDRRIINCSKPPLHERIFTVGVALRRARPTRGWLRRSQ